MSNWPEPNEISTKWDIGTNLDIAALHAASEVLNSSSEDAEDYDAKWADMVYDLGTPENPFRYDPNQTREDLRSAVRKRVMALFKAIVSSRTAVIAWSVKYERRGPGTTVWSGVDAHAATKNQDVWFLTTGERLNDAQMMARLLANGAVGVRLVTGTKRIMAS